jgi:hypothetical protein
MIVSFHITGARTRSLGVVWVPSLKPWFCSKWLPCGTGLDHSTSTIMRNCWKTSLTQAYENFFPNASASVSYSSVLVIFLGNFVCLSGPLVLRHTDPGRFSLVILTCITEWDLLRSIELITSVQLGLNSELFVALSILLKNNFPRYHTNFTLCRGHFKSCLRLRVSGLVLTFIPYSIEFSCYGIILWKVWRLLYR